MNWRAFIKNTSSPVRVARLKAARLYGLYGSSVPFRRSATLYHLIQRV